jgi:hypothetical protein
MNHSELLVENNELKNKIKLLEAELNEVKHKLNTYQSNSKKYYENNKEDIIEKVKNYKKNYKYTPTEEQKKKWARTAYLNKKAKLEQAKLENENV